MYPCALASILFSVLGQWIEIDTTNTHKVQVYRCEDSYYFTTYDSSKDMWTPPQEIFNTQDTCNSNPAVHSCDSNHVEDSNQNPSIVLPSVNPSTDMNNISTVLQTANPPIDSNNHKHPSVYSDYNNPGTPPVPVYNIQPTGIMVMESELIPNSKSPTTGNIIPKESSGEKRNSPSMIKEGPEIMKNNLYEEKNCKKKDTKQDKNKKTSKNSASKIALSSSMILIIIGCTIM